MGLLAKWVAQDELLGSHPGVVPFTVAATTAAYALSVEPKAGSLKATTTPFAIGTVV